MTSVIISGSDGFIAKHLIKKISKKKIKVIKMGKIFGDVSKKNTWDKLPSADVVIHLAGKTFVPDSWKNPKIFFNSNVTGTKMALDYCKKNDAKLIFLSSYMYGNTKKLPTNERAKINANNPLAVTKKKAEDLCRVYSKKYNLKTIILRPSNVYGPNQKSFWLIPEMINKFKKKNITINNLLIKRDMIFVFDLVDAIIKSIYLKNKFEIINIGSGKSYSIGKIIKLMQKKFNKKILIKNNNTIRKNEIIETQLDITKAKKILKWKPFWNLENGLNHTIKLNKK